MQPPTVSFLPTTLLQWPRKSLVQLQGGEVKPSLLLAIHDLSSAYTCHAEDWSQHDLLTLPT